jgi:hypothetical protein
MMIRTVCPSCRATLSLDADDVVLAIRGEPPATYTISCPDCGAVSVKRADSLAEWLLRTAGVVAVPATPLDPVSLPGSPLLSVDDLVDLYLMLADEERSDTLLVSPNLTGQRTQSSTLDGRATPDLTRSDRS